MNLSPGPQKQPIHNRSITYENNNNNSSIQTPTRNTYSPTRTQESQLLLQELRTLEPGKYQSIQSKMILFFVEMERATLLNAELIRENQLLKEEFSKLEEELQKRLDIYRSQFAQPQVDSKLPALNQITNNHEQNLVIIADLKAKINLLLDENSKLIESITGRETEVNQLNQKIELMRQENQNLRMIIEQKQYHHHQQLQQYQYQQQQQQQQQQNRDNRFGYTESQKVQTDLNRNILTYQQQQQQQPSTTSMTNNQENSYLQNKIIMLEKENTKLIALLNEKSREHETVKHELIKKATITHAEKTHETQVSNSLMTENEKLKLVILGLNKDMEALKLKNQGLDSINANLTKTNQDLHSRLFGLTAEMDKLTQENKQFSNELANKARENDQLRISSSTELEAYKKQISTENERLNKLNDDLRNKVRDQDINIALMMNDIQGLNGLLIEKGNNNEGYEYQIQDLKRENKNLKGSVDEKVSEIGRLNEVINEMGSKIAGLMKENEKGEKSLKDLLTESESLKISSSRLKAENENLNSMKQKLEGDLDTLRNHTQQLKNEIDNLNKSLQQVKFDNENLKVTLQKIKSEKDNAIAKLEENNSLHAQFQEFNTHIGLLQSDNKKLCNALEEKARENENLKSLIEEINSKNRKLVSDNEELKKTITMNKANEVKRLGESEERGGNSGYTGQNGQINESLQLKINQLDQENQMISMEKTRLSSYLNEVLKQLETYKKSSNVGTIAADYEKKFALLQVENDKLRQSNQDILKQNDILKQKLLNRENNNGYDINSVYGVNNEDGGGSAYANISVTNSKDLVEIGKLKSQILLLERDNRQLKELLNEKLYELDDIRAKHKQIVHDKDEEILHWKGQVSNLGGTSSQLIDLQMNMDIIISENEKLNSVLNDYKNQIYELKKKLKNLLSLDTVDIAKLKKLLQDKEEDINKKNKKNLN